MKNTGKLLLLSMLLILATAGRAFAQKDMCVPAVGGLGGVPFIDGIIDETGAGLTYDPGWNGATRWNLSGDNGATTSVKFQAGTASSSLYLSFTVDTGLLAPQSDDTIVLGFSTDGIAANDWRIHIFPFGALLPSDPSAGFSPDFVQYWRDSSTWNSPTAIANTAGTGTWLFNNIRISRNGTRWALEMRIPIVPSAGAAGPLITQGMFIPTSGSTPTYSFYANVLNTTGVLPAVIESPWPAGVDIVPGSTPFLAENTPTPPNWGTASLTPRSECDGVSLSWADVGVEFPFTTGTTGTIVQQIKSFTGVTETTEISCPAETGSTATSGPNNVFIARPLNEMTGVANVSATFRIANWGIPATNAFDRIGAPSPFVGVTGNPTTQIAIPPSLKGRLTADWSLTYRQSCLFKFHAHNCIQIDLDSNDPATRFKNKSVQKNMDIVPASTFRQTAEITGDPRGAPEGEQVHRMFITVQTDEQVGRNATPPDARGACGGSRRFRDGDLARAMASYQNENLYSWIARGYVGTGRKLKIRRNLYEIVNRAGDFGYVAVHKGPLVNWQSTFRGPGMEDLKNGIYKLTVQAGKPVTVETAIEAVERWYRKH